MWDGIRAGLNRRIFFAQYKDHRVRSLGFRRIDEIEDNRVVAIGLIKERYEGVQLGRTPRMGCSRWTDRVTGGANRDEVQQFGLYGRWRYLQVLVIHN